MSDAALQLSEIEPVDIQRLLVWYFESVEPGRPRIRGRVWDAARHDAVASAGR